MKRLIGTIALAGALAGCGASREPGVYDVSVDEAYRRLSESQLPELRLGRQCGILIHMRPEGVPNRSVTWRVFSSGREMLNFTVNLSPAGEGRVRTAIQVSPDPRGGEAYDGDKFYPRPAFAQPIRPAIEEQVAALLEGRHYDAVRVPRNGDNHVCNVQRAGLEHGHRFSVNDDMGTDSAGTSRARAARGWGADASEGWGR